LKKTMTPIINVLTPKTQKLWGATELHFWCEKNHGGKEAETLRASFLLPETGGRTYERTSLNFPTLGDRCGKKISQADSLLGTLQDNAGGKASTKKGQTVSSRANRGV